LREISETLQQPTAATVTLGQRPSALVGRPSALEPAMSVSPEQHDTSHAQATPPLATPPPSPDEPVTQPAGPARATTLRTAVVAAVVAALVAAGTTFGITQAVAPNGSASLDQQVVEAPVDAAPTAPGTTVTELAAQVSPSVGFVQVVGPQGQGSGSAVIVDPDGFLLTNAHVVAGAEQIGVTLPDGTAHEAELVGADPTSDVAVLEIAADGLPAVEVAERVSVGDEVIAIGSPFGLEGSVTAGIVSGLDRTLQGGPDQPALLGMIQTDAAINPGNSGGALIDGQGRLVGINTAIYSATGTSAGIGFAIPAATALAIAQQLIETGEVTYAQLGISGGDVTPAVAEAYGVEVPEGAVVIEVLEGSGADEAGIEPGDVIVGFDGEAIDSMSGLTSLVRTRTPGDEVEVVLDRDGEQLERTVVLQAAD
jgi:S1-C subfamily serine protease